MKYIKPPLTYEKQAQKLISRGLVSNKSDLIIILQRINYYRLTFYLFPFRKENSEKFQNGTTLEQILNIYEFDNKLRNLAFRYIGELEISVLHSLMVKNFATKYGSFGYLDINNFREMKDRNEYDKGIYIMRNSVSRSKEEFVKHFRDKYVSEYDLPMWMAVETCSFGNLSGLFGMMKPDDQKLISDIYKVSNEIMRSWLHTLSVVRNMCAHHARFFNRKLGIAPKSPRRNKLPEFYDPYLPMNNRLFSVFSIMKHMLTDISLEDKFKTDLNQLLSDYSEIDMVSSGFEENWQEHKLWR